MKYIIKPIKWNHDIGNRLYQAVTVVGTFRITEPNFLHDTFKVFQVKPIYKLLSLDINTIKQAKQFIQVYYTNILLENTLEAAQKLK